MATSSLRRWTRARARQGLSSQVSAYASATCRPSAVTDDPSNIHGEPASATEVDEDEDDDDGADDDEEEDEDFNIDDDEVSIVFYRRLRHAHSMTMTSDTDTSCMRSCTARRAH